MVLPLFRQSINSCGLNWLKSSGNVIDYNGGAVFPTRLRRLVFAARGSDEVNSPFASIPGNKNHQLVELQV